MSEKSKKITAILYVIALVATFLFVQKTLNTKSVDVITKGEVELADEVKKANVALSVRTADTTATSTYEMTDAENVYQLLEAARLAGAVYFETTEYADRIELKFFQNNVEYKGTVFLNGEDVTNRMRDIRLADGLTYTVRLSK